MNDMIRFFKVLAFVVVYVWFSSCAENKKEFTQEIENNIQLETSILGVSVVADSLEVPWEITWGPDDWIWVTEQKGVVSRIDPTSGEKRELLTLDSVWVDRTPGLLGMVVHPDQKKYPYVFIVYTFEQDSQFFSRLERYTYQKDTLTEPKVLMEIPAWLAHNGSRLAFSGKDKLFWATGDIKGDGNAQNIEILNGKVLRMDFDGNIPDDNPIKGSYIWALGMRNMQGLVMASNGHLYASEHGDAIEDEVNLILPTRNYGWDVIEGVHDQEYEKAYAKLHKAVEPLRSWTPTIAPAGLDYYASDKILEWKNSLLLTTLKGKSLRVLKLNEEGNTITDEEIYLENSYGRIRDLCISPSGDVYISTSNRDWNPMIEPSAADDRILRIAKVEKAVKAPLKAKDKEVEKLSYQTGDVLYQKYCLACHKMNGKGLAGTFPSLVGSKIVADINCLIPFVLKGSDAEVKMPSFKFLNNEELGKILNYIGGSWGNKTDTISVSEVERFR